MRLKKVKWDGRLPRFDDKGEGIPDEFKCGSSLAASNAHT